jgi:hypothetical protein
MKTNSKIKSDNELTWEFMKQYLCIPEDVIQNALRSFAKSKQRSLEKKAEAFFRSFLSDIEIESKKLSEHDKKLLSIFELILISRALIDDMMTPKKPDVSREEIIEAQGDWTARECLELLGRASQDGTTRTWQNWISMSNEKRRLNPEEFVMFKFKKTQVILLGKIDDLNR